MATCYAIDGKPKHRFATELLAQAALVEAVMKRNRGNAKRQECRHYPCDKCNGWHLTSRPALRPAARPRETGSPA